VRLGRAALDKWTRAPVGLAPYIDVLRVPRLRGADQTRDRKTVAIARLSPRAEAPGFADTLLRRRCAGVLERFFTPDANVPASCPTSVRTGPDPLDSRISLSTTASVKRSHHSAVDPSSGDGSLVNFGWPNGRSHHWTIERGSPAQRRHAGQRPRYGRAGSGGPGVLCSQTRLSTSPDGVGLHVEQHATGSATGTKVAAQESSEELDGIAGDGGEDHLLSGCVAPVDLREQLCTLGDVPRRDERSAKALISSSRAMAPIGKISSATAA
jgi:hypothetical protein